jgi:hypothetical protein
LIVPSASARPAAPTLLGPSGSTSDVTPTYAWIGSSAASEYLLWVNDASGTRIQQSYSAESAGCAAGGTCSVTPPEELVNGSARFWVQAKNAAGSSAWSTSLTFQVQAAPCASDEIFRALKLVEVALSATGVYGRVVVQNTSERCPVALRDVHVCHALADCAVPLPADETRILAPGERFAFDEDYGGPWTSMIGAYNELLCVGPCADGTRALVENIVDALAFPDMPALPPPATMSPAVARIYDFFYAQYSYQRIGFAGRYPTFEQADWTTAIRADNPCPPPPLMGNCDPQQYGGLTCSTTPDLPGSRWAPVCACEPAQDPTLNVSNWRCYP